MNDGTNKAKVMITKVIKYRKIQRKTSNKKEDENKNKLKKIPRKSADGTYQINKIEWKFKEILVKKKKNRPKVMIKRLLKDLKIKKKWSVI